jgi:signal transduction histidine kinase
MKYEKTIKEFKEYINKGLEIIYNDDPEYRALLGSAKKQLEEQKKNNDLENSLTSFSKFSSGRDTKPEVFILSSVISALLRDKEISEKKLNDVTSSYDEVLGLITHEFKNILTSIHGYNMLLEKHLDQERDKEYFIHLMDSDRLTRQLFDMTNSLLKMSLGEKGLLKPELKLIDFVEDLLEPLKRDLESQLHIKKMRIVLKRQTKNMILECDEGLLDIVIRNLLINAIKYGKQNSEITVGINRDKNDFFVLIKNKSEAIPGDLCDGIFEKFRSRKIGSEMGGTGIGLYNVKNIINLHQGNITCKCLAGKWIEFRFNIPQKI